MRAGQLGYRGWQPHPDDEEKVPPLVWLPSMGIVVAFDGSDTWRPAGEVPQSVLSSEIAAPGEPEDDSGG